MTLTDEWVVSSAKRTVTSGLLELHRARPVLYALVKRELKSRYRGSVFGFAWALGKPISMLLVFTLFIGEILGASRSIEYYALYIFVGLMFWGFFSESIVGGTNSLIQSGGLIQKVAFPREIVPLTSIVIAGVNTLIQIPVLIAGYLIFDAWPTLSQLILLLPTIPTLIFLAIGLTFVLSSVNVYIRDVQPLTELVISLLIYASPIIYSWTFVKERVLNSYNGEILFNLYMLNPITALTTSFQDALWPGLRKYQDGLIAGQYFSISSIHLWALLIFSMVFSYFSYKLFLKLEPNFAREL